MDVKKKVHPVRQNAGIHMEEKEIKRQPQLAFRCSEEFRDRFIGFARLRGYGDASSVLRLFAEWWLEEVEAGRTPAYRKGQNTEKEEVADFVDAAGGLAMSSAERKRIAQALLVLRCGDHYLINALESILDVLARYGGTG